MLLLIPLFVLATIIDAIRQVHVQKEWFRYPGNPGIKMRLNKKGANHFKTIGVQIFNDYISQLKNYSTSLPFSQLGLNGIVEIKKLYVKNYHPPQLTVLNFLPPRYVVLGLENLDISIGSQFKATALPLIAEGSLDGSIVGMTIAITTELLTDVSGQLSAIVRNCSTIISRSHITLNPSGPMSLFIKPLEPMINDMIRQKIPETLCAKMQNFIEKSLSKLFDYILRINLGEFFPKVEGDQSDVMKIFIKQFSEGMFIDNRLMYQPLITMDYIETSHLGEIRFAKTYKNPTPFYARPMVIEDPPTDHMAHFYISDHLPNSMLYHAYQDNRLSLRIDASNLPDEMRSFVATSCPSLKHQTPICVGNLISQIGKTFPNSTTSFVILPHGLPYVMFNKESTGIEMSNRVLTYVKDENDAKNKSQILVFSINGQADIQFNPIHEALNAEMNLNRFNVRLHRSSVRGIDDSSISRLAPLSKTFIAPRLNNAIKNAARFPKDEAIRFTNLKITNHNGFIVLATDFQINKLKLAKIVRKYIDK